MPPDHETFAGWVRDALNRLYDSPYLQAHPLAALLAGEEGDIAPRRSQNLRRVLLEAIQEMRPGAGVPAQSPDWRAYRILELRYIEGLSPNEVMERLALGKSQYFRDQARVLDALTDMLWEQWQETHAVAMPATEVSGAVREELVHAETERLRAQATWEAVDTAELLDDLRAVVEPLARAKDATIHFAPMQHLTVLHADRVILRQAVLGVVTHALDIARGGRVEIGSFAGAGETGIRVVACGGLAAPPSGPAQDGDTGLEIGRQLMAAMRGTLYLGITERGDWEARLAWPVAELCVLLVVDDNAAFVDLFRRYLAGYNWQVVGATSGAEARRVIAETHPTAIALDVMMPKEDGWEFLMALKADVDTRNIPVVVCSVLNEPQLALTLGAAAYLVKPVAQQALLRTLAPWSRSGASLGPAR
jgi:CheY-like chemotaxis protein